MRNLPAIHRDILYVITGEDTSYGLANKVELEDYSEAEVNHGRLSPNLDDIVEKNLVEKGKLDKRTNIYTLTGEGERARETRREWKTSISQRTRWFQPARTAKLDGVSRARRAAVTN